MGEIVFVNEPEERSECPRGHADCSLVWVEVEPGRFRPAADAVTERRRASVGTPATLSVLMAIAGGLASGAQLLSIYLFGAAVASLAIAALNFAGGSPRPCRSGRRVRASPCRRRRAAWLFNWIRGGLPLRVVAGSTRSTKEECR